MLLKWSFNQNDDVILIDSIAKLFAIAKQHPATDSWLHPLMVFLSVQNQIRFAI